MVEREAIVGFEEGIHGRPASDLIKLAKQYNSQVRMINGKKEGNAKSPLQMVAFARKGDAIVVRADGEDAEEAVEALVRFVSAGEH
ncbi:MAG: HPr family phosphocarrier protein [Rubrobacter sp.]